MTDLGRVRAPPNPRIRLSDSLTRTGKPVFVVYFQNPEKAIKSPGRCTFLQVIFIQKRNYVPSAKVLSADCPRNRRPGASKIATMWDRFDGKCVLITGGSGFLGTTIVYRLVTRTAASPIYILCRGGRRSVLFIDPAIQVNRKLKVTLELYLRDGGRPCHLNTQISCAGQPASLSLMATSSNQTWDYPAPKSTLSARMWKS